MTTTRTTTRTTRLLALALVALPLVLGVACSSDEDAARALTCDGGILDRPEGGPMALEACGPATATLQVSSEVLEIEGGTCQVDAQGFRVMVGKIATPGPSTDTASSSTDHATSTTEVARGGISPLGQADDGGTSTTSAPTTTTQPGQLGTIVIIDVPAGDDAETSVNISAPGMRNAFPGEATVTFTDGRRRGTFEGRDYDGVPDGAFSGTFDCGEDVEA